MPRKLRMRMAAEEKGYTLVELLVVILIVGILAGIALTAFIGQRQKGQDAEAKTVARIAATAEESYYTDEKTHTADKADLEKIEPSLGGENYAPSGASATGYTITATSNSGANFIVTKAAGVASRTCNQPGDGGCPKSGKW